MKYIEKGKPPAELTSWFTKQPVENGHRINCSYKDIPSEVKEVIKERLVSEQGGLCCYTGMRIGSTSSHIEHFKPQALCEGHEDVDYDNLLAAYPDDGYVKRRHKNCQFGAHAKEDWYDRDLLVNPLRGGCEARFSFNQFGEIRPTSDEDPAAIETISRLRLDDYSLTEMRRRAINAALFPKNKQRSEAQLRSITQEFCSRNRKQQFPEFCFVIAHAASDILRKIDRRRKKKQAIRKAMRK